MRTQCPSCGHQGNLPERSPAPALVRCPHCDATFQPTAAPAAVEMEGAYEHDPPRRGAVIFCRRCGAKNPENTFKCIRCEAALHDLAMLPLAQADDGTLGGLVPLKNSHALIAYYLGVFSLIPCIGLVLGVMALGFGISGVKFANLHPEAKGKVHAWVGIVLGGFCALFNLALIVVPVILSLMRM